MSTAIPPFFPLHLLQSSILPTSVHLQGFQVQTLASNTSLPEALKDLGLLYCNIHSISIRSNNCQTPQPLGINNTHSSQILYHPHAHYGSTNPRLNQYPPPLHRASHLLPHQWALVSCQHPQTPSAQDSSKPTSSSPTPPSNRRIGSLRPDTASPRRHR